MPDKGARELDVLVATYDGIAAAETDLMAVRDLYQTLGSAYNFDAAVVRKNENGEPKIHRTYEAGTRHEARKGLGVGLAAGLIAAAFPAVGIATALAAGAGGAAIGALVGHAQSGISRDDLRKIADRLDASQAALVVVHETNVADQVGQSIRAAAGRLVAKVKDMRAELVGTASRAM